MLGTQLIGRLVEEPREIFYRTQVALGGTLCIVAPLELLQHALS
jgi:hypothetical protein